MVNKETHYQQLTPEAEAAVRLALEPVAHERNGFGLAVEAHESYDCESCGASFTWPADGILCPMCNGQLSGKVEIHFTPPYPPEPEIPCSVCGDDSTLTIVTDGIPTAYCREHYPPIHTPTTGGRA